jgi:hypothetical protein
MWQRNRRFRQRRPKLLAVHQQKVGRPVFQKRAIGLGRRVFLGMEGEYLTNSLLLFKIHLLGVSSQYESCDP